VKQTARRGNPGELRHTTASTAVQTGYCGVMDVDHEAHKHDVPRSTVKGEAERVAAEDPAEQVQDAVDDAKRSAAREKESGPAAHDADGERAHPADPKHERALDRKRAARKETTRKD
jgi:hypothetical protein